MVVILKKKFNFFNKIVEYFYFKILNFFKIFDYNYWNRILIKISLLINYYWLIKVGMILVRLLLFVVIKIFLIF
jgi:hypothetical protein